MSVNEATSTSRYAAIPHDDVTIKDLGDLSGEQVSKLHQHLNLHPSRRQDGTPRCTGLIASAFLRLDDYGTDSQLEADVRFLMPGSRDTAEMLCRVGIEEMKKLIPLMEKPGTTLEQFDDAVMKVESRSGRVFA